MKSHSSNSKSMLALPKLRRSGTPVDSRLRPSTTTVIQSMMVLRRWPSTAQEFTQQTCALAMICQVVLVITINRGLTRKLADRNTVSVLVGCYHCGFRFGYHWKDSYCCYPSGVLTVHSNENIDKPSVGATNCLSLKRLNQLAVGATNIW